MDDTFRTWLLDADPAIVVHRLVHLLGRQGHSPLHWHRLPEVEIVPSANGDLTARIANTDLSFAFNSRAARYRTVTVQAKESPGRYRLSAKCDACYSFSDTPCTHALSAVIHMVSRARPDVAALLQSPRALQEHLLSDRASLFLSSVEQSSAPTDQPTVSGSKLLLYVIDPPEAGVARTLRLEGRSILKDGSKSARASSYRWASLQQLWTLPPPDMSSVYGRVASHGYAGIRARDADDAPEADWVTPEDLRIIKQIFVDAALPGSERLDLVGANMAQAWRLMVATERLFAGPDVERALKLGAVRAAAWTWQRGEDDLWQLAARVDGDGYILPCDPPWFVDAAEGVIGPLIGRWPREMLAAATAARGFTDRDLGLLERHAGGQLGGRGLPPMPRIETVQGGMLRPKALARLNWFFDDAVYEPSEDPLSRSPSRKDIGHAELRLEFTYDGVIVGAPDDAQDGARVAKARGAQRIIYERDLAFEQECFLLVANHPSVKAVQGYTIDLGRGRYSTPSLRARLQAYHLDVVPRLHAAGWSVLFSPFWPFAAQSVSGFDYRIDAETAGDAPSGWLGFSIEATVDGLPIDMVGTLVELLGRRDVLATLADPDGGRSWTVPGPNGYRLAVPVEILRRLLPLITALNLEGNAEGKAGRPRLRRLDFGALEAARAGTDSRLAGGQTLVALAASLREVPSELPAPVRAALLGEPRSYQVYGSNWCDVRRREGFGAIIGDEYAAGKTLQGLLTIFAAYHESPAAAQPASLIVVTKTLLFEQRWQQDAERFLPGMRILRIATSAEVELLLDLRSYHAVLTTYDVIVNKLESFQGIHWNVVACDEGHKLGNSATHKARALDGLAARQKLVITGSPMQNSPRELWSVMNIAVPGLLRHKAWFERTFPKVRVVAGSDPARMKEVDAQAWRANAARLTALGKLIAPFYLRRTNDELGRSLPLINEVYRAVVMEEAQAQAYEAVRASCDARVKSLIERAGFDRSKQEIIVAINRLRQLCADPRLIATGPRSVQGVPSAKLEAVLDICRELAQEGKKTVVVSEWTEMLKLIQAALTEEGLTSALLHGELSGPARQRASQGFRGGKTQVLLIQLLLAEGIELPEGDAIILYEPWWNTKREEQAIARLRRDERDKHVTVVRLIVPGSVEIGVQRVAQAKLADIEAVLEGHASGRGGGLTSDDVAAILSPLRGSAPG